MNSIIILFKRRQPVVAFYLSKKLYGMKSIWFKVFAGILAGLGMGAAVFPAPEQAGAYQVASTPTGIFITVTYTDPMNVRNGPGTFYDIIGQIFPGDVFPALGISPGREWIQISYAQGPGGIGWVYTAYVSVSGGELQIVEPPPTPAPLITNTIDPTLAAAFNIQPTLTRMATFTPPPPLVIPQFTDEASPVRSPVRSGYLIVGLGLLGFIGLVVSFIFRR
jgi:hypothetical protein